MGPRTPSVIKMIRPTHIRTDSHRQPPRVHSLVLLAGQVRPTELSAPLRRSLVDLPVEAGTTLLDAWLRQTIGLAPLLGLSRLPLRVCVDRRSPAPSVVDRRDPLAAAVEVDRADYRGAGGVLRDLAEPLDDDDWLLVAPGGQLWMEPIGPIVHSLLEGDGEVRLACQYDGILSGLMLLRCGALRCIPDIGFVDFKEQALPRIAASHRVTVHRHPQPAGLPVRTRHDYLQALLQYHRRDSGGSGDSRNGFVERWRPTFALIEPAAEVSASARVHDSVVLAGARLAPGATLVRSVACPGAVVAANQCVSDRILTHGADHRGRP